MSSSAEANQSVTSKLKSKIIQDLIAERDKYVTRNEPEDKKSDELFQIAAAGIGFVSEVIHHHKDKETQKHSKQDAVIVRKTQEHPQARGTVHLSPVADDRAQV